MGETPRPPTCGWCGRPRAGKLTTCFHCRWLDSYHGGSYRQARIQAGDALSVKDGRWVVIRGVRRWVPYEQEKEAG